jgi:hypothetical protein
MLSNDDVRTLLHEDNEALPAIDTASVIRRSRLRRLPRQLGFGAVLVVAVVGAGVAGITSLQVPRSATIASDLAESGESGGVQPLDSTAGAYSGTAGGAWVLNECGSPLTPVTPSQIGLVLTTDFPPQRAATTFGEVTPIAGVVTLTNTGRDFFRGTTATPPAITVAREGVSVWHSNGRTPLLLTEVELKPGKSIEFEALFMPLLCDERDEGAEGFRDSLPPLKAGVYTISAAIVVATGDGTESHLISGPAQKVELH